MTLGISTKVLRDYPLQEAIEIAREYGYGEMEFWIDDLQSADLSTEEIIARTDAYGIGRSVHLKTEDLNLASFNEPIRQESVRQQMEGIRLAARLGARTATLHPGRKTAKTHTVEAAWELQLRSIGELAVCAEECGVTLCVEAMERLAGEFVLTPENLQKVCGIGSKALAVTLDLSHLHTVGDVCGLLERARGLPVRNVHISQSKGTKPHLNVFDPEGEIDFRRALPALEAVYDGPLILEGYAAGRGKEIAERSMAWYRGLNCAAEPEASPRGGCSMATIRGIPVMESVEIAVRSGCSGIEIQTDYLPEAAEERECVFAVAREQGLWVTLHGPSSDINLSSLNRGIREESLRQIQEAIAIASRYGVKTLTIHPGKLSSVRENTEEKWRVLLAAVKEAANYAKSLRVHLGIENMEKRKKELVFSVEDLNRFAPIAAENPYFGVTLDFCHFATNGILAPELEQLQLPVKNVHISQCIGEKPHFALNAEGTVSMADVKRRLQTAGYEGPVVMEIKSVYDYRVYEASRIAWTAAGTKGEPNDE